MMKTNTVKSFTQNLLLSGLILGCTLSSNVYAQRNTRNLGPRNLSHQGSTILAQGGIQLCRTPLFGKRFAKTELYFGSLKPNGSDVTEQDFQRFLDSEITPRFPDGLTLHKGLGQFKNSKGKIIEETSRVLILLYPFGGSDSNKKIEQIRKTYETRFRQESVLRVDDESCVSF